MAERELATYEAIAEAIGQEMERDERVFVMGEDIGVWGGVFGMTHGLYEKFGPERVMDTPISPLSAPFFFSSGALTVIPLIMEESCFELYKTSPKNNAAMAPFPCKNSVITYTRRRYAIAII